MGEIKSIYTSLMVGVGWGCKHGFVLTAPAAVPAADDDDGGGRDDDDDDDEENALFFLSILTLQFQFFFSVSSWQCAVQS